MNATFFTRAFAVVCLGTGYVFGLGALIETYSYFNGLHPLTQISPLLKAAMWAAASAITIKAGSAWLRETKQDWEKRRWQRIKDKWRRREPDAWWIERYPIHSMVSSKTPRWLSPDGEIDYIHARPEGSIARPYEKFKSDLAEWGYGPNFLDPLNDGTIERWKRQYYASEGDPRGYEADEIPQKT